MVRVGDVVKRTSKAPLVRVISRRLRGLASFKDVPPLLGGTITHPFLRHEVGRQDLNIITAWRYPNATLSGWTGYAVLEEV
jgi:hypothetical protein